MFWTRTTSFRSKITRLVGRAGGRLLQIGGDSAAFDIPGEYQEYTFGVGEEKGKVFFMVYSLIYWRGSAPPAVYGLMEKLDRDDRTVGFAVRTLDSGKTKCRLVCGGVSLDDLDDDLFQEAVSTLLARVTSLDAALEKRYA